jgi:hypothetical protein
VTERFFVSCLCSDIDYVYFVFVELLNIAVFVLTVLRFIYLI